MEWQKYQVTESEFKALKYENKIVEIPDCLPYNTGVEVVPDTWNGELNCIYDATVGGLRKLNSYNGVFDSFPNRDLLLLNDLLLNDDITTIVVDGLFGVGKTALVSSHIVDRLLHEGKDRHRIDHLYFSKPHQSLGKSYGYLPGDLEDKTYPEFKSFYQYINRFGQPYMVDKLLSEDKMTVLVFEYLRGIDIDSGWLVLDEAQNTNKMEMISLISRVGDDARLIILGDSSPYQIDAKDNTPDNNGLVFAKKVYKDKKYSAVVELRSLKHIIRGRRVVDLYNYLLNN